jgi:hypothetical protein
LIIALALLPALTGCGGDGGGGGGGGGKTHPLGEAVVVQHTDLNAPGKPKTSLAITVKAVRKGTQAELTAAGFTLDEPDEKSATPYYVDTTFENRGPGTIKRSLFVSIEDDKDTTVSSTVVIDLGGKPFEKCPNTKPADLATGETFEKCSLFLVPEGRTPKKISFLPYDPSKPTDFVYWDAQ